MSVDTGLLRAWDRIEALPGWIFVAWITALVALRSGVSWYGSGELDQFARSFPHPGATFRSNAVLGPTLAWATGMDSHAKWVILHAGLTAGWWALTAALLRRRVSSRRAWRVAMVWLSFLTPPASLLRHLGGYDVFTAIGATLIALGANPLLAVLGGVAMGATNIEQGTLAVLCGALVYWAIPGDGGERRTMRAMFSRFAAAFVGLAVSRIAVLAWFGALGTTVQGRRAELGALLFTSLGNAAALGATGTFAWLSVGWVVVAVVIWQLRDRPQRWMAAVIALVAVPAAATITTLDGNRVFAAVGAVALLLALVCFAETSERPAGTWILRLSAALMLFGILVPAVVTTYGGGVRPPWRFVMNL